MMKIKKLFLTVVLLVLCACCALSFVGCADEDEGWIEVQSITYFTNSDQYGSNSYVSTAHKLSDVKVKFLDNNCLKIDTGEEILRVLPLSYTIVY